MFNNVDLAVIRQKVFENPKVSLGAAGVGVAAIALIYALTKSSSHDIDDEIDGLPDYTRNDVDIEFTQRFVKNRNRKRTISDHRKKRIKPVKTGNNMIDRNNEKNEEKKDIDIDDNADIKYSLLDPNNPNYSYDMNSDQENDENESEGEEGFSADQYYVPFRVNNAKTKRKPDAPFMAMFKMYANAPNTEDPSSDLEININENKQTENTMDDNNNGDDEEEEEEEEEEKEEKKENDDDIGSSPPLNPHIPSHNIGGSVLNPLDNLRERYYKKQLPPSLQPTSLSNAFSSDTQKAIQNDLNADDSLLGGIKQSVQMITQSND